MRRHSRKSRMLSLIATRDRTTCWVRASVLEQSRRGASACGCWSKLRIRFMHFAATLWDGFVPEQEKSSLVAAFAAGYSLAMSTVSEIQAALPRLTTEELQAVDAALREQFRARKLGVLYDDAYGLWTEADQASAGAAAFALMDHEEKRRERS